MMAAKRAFYALCTQIDFQIRYLIGTLRLEGILDDTIILFTSDHGDMLGNHDMAAKRIFYESSANIPMILSANKGNPKAGVGVVDDRLVAFCDVMPTLLDLCDIPVPDTVDGQSMVSEARRSHVYGECGEDDHASRMIRDERHKLIYYPVGNHFQLFDLIDDPREMTDLAGDPAHAQTLTRVQEVLLSEMYGADLDWIENGRLVGKPDRAYRWAPHRSLNSQRGDGWPPSPKVDIPQIEWTRER
jgi:arylsulfatase A-like enzyme